MQGPQLEVLIDAVLSAVGQRLGPGADPQLTQLVVREVVQAVLSGQEGAVVNDPTDFSDKVSRAVITCSGKNSRGIVSAVSTATADAGADILDMSQTIVSDFFTMILLVDISRLELSFSEMKARLKTIAEQKGFHIIIMHEDVLRALQRV